MWRLLVEHPTEAKAFLRRRAVWLGDNAERLGRHGKGHVALTEPSWARERRAEPGHEAVEGTSEA